MKYLPFENINYKTKLAKEEILKRVSEVTEPKKNFRLKGFNTTKRHKPYEGNVEANSFSLSRIIDYRNSFLPRIKGRIERDPSGTLVNLRMTLHPLVLLFMCIWFGGVLIGCLIAISTFEINDFEPTTLIPLGMLVFGYALVTGGFKYESSKSKKYFAKLLEAEPEEC